MDFVSNILSAEACWSNKLVVDLGVCTTLDLSWCWNCCYNYNDGDYANHREVTYE